MIIDYHIRLYKTWLTKANYDLPRMIMVDHDFHIETIFVIMWHWDMVKTMIDFHIEIIFVTM